jgi:hypothetical protein
MERYIQKLYFYVDESGQDTLGRFFIVSVVVARTDRQKSIEALENIEQYTGKGKVKWMESRHKARFEYIKAVLCSALFKDTFYFSKYEGNTSYMVLTVLSAARVILTMESGDSTKVVYVDGLPKSRLRWFGSELRRLGVHNCKVISIRKEEANTLMRLADACCGFIRAALLGRDPEVTKLFELAKRNGYIKQV